MKLDGINTLSLLGHNDSHLQLIEKRFNAMITVRGNQVTMRGEEIELDQLERIFKELQFILQKNGMLHIRDINTVLDLVTEPATPHTHRSVPTHGDETAILFTKNSIIKAKTPTQKLYLEKAQNNDIVFAIGPAGTGKTYLAVAMAVASLKNNEVSKITLARPAVEAGESLGFLPGDMTQKVDPYLRPLYDALDDMLPSEKLKLYLERRVIEIVPLAYMRGRTLSNAFVILDEAQNATGMQMKMFLTRLGNNSKAIITGDITQIDLPEKAVSGLVQVQDVLKKIKGIDFVYFDKGDVVRHRLVKDIIDAYAKKGSHENRKRS